MRRRGLAMLLALLLVGGLASSARADWTPRLDLIEWVNNARQAHGLRPVQISWWVNKQAQVHATNMAEAGRIFHCGWFYGGEAVGALARGRPVRVLFEAFMDSPVHRAVILSPRWDAIGVGMRGTDDAWFVAIFFA